MDFLRPVLTLANTPFRFFAFFSSFSSPIFFFFFLDSSGVHTTLRKIWDTLNEKPQRNYWSKFGSLKYKGPQLWHSAMVPHHGWDGMGWDGMGWDGMGWDGIYFGVTTALKISFALYNFKMTNPICYLYSNSQILITCLDLPHGHRLGY